jgi:hypothetical protein
MTYLFPGEGTNLGEAVYPAAFEPGPCDSSNGGGWRGSVQAASVALVRQQHPTWARERQEAQAKNDFQAAALKFIVTTMETVKRIRPKARWGYYMWPYLLRGVYMSYESFNLP